MEKQKPPHLARTLVGAMLLAGSVAAVLIPLFTTGLTMLHLWSALGLGVLGGLMTDPGTFKAISADLIDNLPGGKK